MRRLSPNQLAKLLEQESKPTWFLGAGASWPVLPIANKIKTAIVCNVSHRLSDKGKMRFGVEYSHLLESHHLTLELLCSMFLYRCVKQEKHGQGPAEMLQAIFDVPPDISDTAYVEYFTLLSQMGLLGPILTTNFDTLLTSAVPDVRVLTARQLADNRSICPSSRDIFALHGTFHDWPGPGQDSEFTVPSSTTSRGFARPLSLAVEDYLIKAIKGRTVIFVGYSGGDHFDINPVLTRLLREDTKQCADWYWLCHFGQPTDVSPLIRKRFGWALHNGKADRLLYQYLSCKGHGVGEPDETADESWIERLERFFEQYDQNAVEGFEAFLEDLVKNVHGAWLTTEQYYLVSVGLQEKHAYDMAGIPLEGRRAEASALGTLSVHNRRDFALLFTSMQQYERDRRRLWQLHDRTSTANSSGSPRRNLLAGARNVVARAVPATLLQYVIQSFFYRRSVRMFQQCMRAFDSSLTIEYSRPEYRGLRLVGKAIALNYLGLIRSDQRRVAERLLLGNDGIGRSLCSRLAVRDALQQTREDMRNTASKHFAECIEFCDLAERELSKASRELGRIDELVPYEVTRVHATENAARNLPLEQRTAALKSCVRAREQRIERHRSAHGEKEFFMAELPQSWLRASEWIKAALHVDQDTDLPVRWNDLENTSDVEKAVSFSTEAFKEFHLSVRYSRLYPGYFEGQLLEALSRGDEVRAKGVISKLDEYENLRKRSGDTAWPSESSAWQRVRGRYEAWLGRKE